MFRVLRIIAVVLLLLGTWEVLNTVSFVRSGVAITGIVSPTEKYRGPPRSPRAIPFNVTFKDPGSEQEIIVSLPSPILMSIKVGTSVPLIVNPQQLNEARLNLLSELWAFPCGLVLGAIILWIISEAALKVRSPFQREAT